jgi:hypothetical protein
MGTIAWQWGQVGDWNSTRLGRGARRTSESKLPDSRTTSFDAPPPPEAGGLDGVGDEEPPPPQPAARAPATSTAAVLRLTRSSFAEDRG